jgi:sodium/bile acid cotransporter 7
MMLALSAMMAVLTAIAAGSGPAWGANEMTDAAKLARVESMYRGYRKDFPAVQDIEPQEALRLLQEGRALFIDSREEREQAVSMLPAAIPEKEFLKAPERYPDRVLIGYCTISYRSGKLAQQLAGQGIKLINLRGGMLGWVHAGGKIYDRNGETLRLHVYGRKWDLAPQAYETTW